MKKKKFVWLKLIATFSPLLALLIIVNIYYDPVNVFHNVSRSIADSLLANNSTYITSGNMNEREVKQYIIEDMPEDIDCISIGSSTMFGIRSEHVGTENYYNLGVSGADFYDILAQFGLMEIHGKVPKRVIFCVDTYFFDENMLSILTRHIPYKPYANYMIQILNGENPSVPQKNTFADDIQKFSQMFSVSSFQTAVDYFMEYKTLNVERWGIADADYDGTYSYYLADGSMMYPVDYRNNTVDDVVKDAASYDVTYYFSSGEHISETSMDVFEKLICYLEDQGTEVILFLPPLCPSLWNKCSEDVTPILWEVEAFAQEMAEKYELKMVGSYNPYTVGMTDADFYDCRHMRHECLDEYFDFK